MLIDVRAITRMLHAMAPLTLMKLKPILIQSRSSNLQGYCVCILFEALHRLHM